MHALWGGCSTCTALVGRGRLHSCAVALPRPTRVNLDPPTRFTAETCLNLRPKPAPLSTTAVLSELRSAPLPCKPAPLRGVVYYNPFSHVKTRFPPRRARDGLHAEAAREERQGFSPGEGPTSPVVNYIRISRFSQTSISPAWFTSYSGGLVG